MISDLTHITQPFLSAWGDVWGGVYTYIPNIILAIVIVFVGWLIASLVKKLVSRIINSIKIIDSALRDAGLEKVLNRAGLSLNTGRFVGVLFEIFIVVLFIIFAFDVLGLEGINAYLSNTVIIYIPQVFVASIIIMATAIIARFIKAFISGAAKAADLRSSQLAGGVAYVAVWVFGVLTALSQLGIAQNIINDLVSGVILAIALAVGLSFGFGGQQAAGDLIKSVRDKVR